MDIPPLGVSWESSMAEETCDLALISEVGLHLQDWGGGTRKGGRRREE